MKVLMLGWEYPPKISGGLGVACEGLAQGLVSAGAEVLFLMPSAAGSALIRLGELVTVGAAAARPTTREASRASLQARAGREALRLLKVESPLAPYQSAHSYNPSAGAYGADLCGEVERFAQAAAKEVAGESFDVIHAHDWMCLPAAFLIAAQSGRPVVWHVHSTEFDRRSSPRHVDPTIVAIEQWGLDAAEHVVCVSRFAAEVLRANYRLHGDKLSIVHNGIKHSAAHKKPRQRRPKERPMILFLGRLTEQKGPRWFLRAAAEVLRQLPGARFVIAGEGDLYPGLLRFAEELGIGRSVHFTGFLEGRDVQRMYALADVYVMPSISEPFGIAALEAIHADVPVVISQQSGVAEVIPSALRVDPTDSGATARAILGLCADPALCRRQTQAARRELEPLRWERSAELLMDVFGELCR